MSAVSTTATTWYVFVWDGKSVRKRTCGSEIGVEVEDALTLAEATEV